MIAYTNNDEFNKIFRKYNISQKEYEEIIKNNLLFDMTAIAEFYISTKKRARIIKLHKYGKQRTNEIFMKRTLKALFNQQGLIACIGICRELINKSILEIENYDKVINIQKVIDLLKSQLNRVIKRSN